MVQYNWKSYHFPSVHNYFVGFQLIISKAEALNVSKFISMPAFDLFVFHENMESVVVLFGIESVSCHKKNYSLFGIADNWTLIISLSAGGLFIVLVSAIVFVLVKMITSRRRETQHARQRHVIPLLCLKKHEIDKKIYKARIMNDKEQLNKIVYIYHQLQFYASSCCTTFVAAFSLLV